MNPLILGLEGCDCESDSLNLFDVEEPSGEYKLDMSLPYSRMVASELLSLSESKKGHEVTKLYAVGNDCGRWRSLERLQKPDMPNNIRCGRNGRHQKAAWLRRCLVPSGSSYGCAWLTLAPLLPQFVLRFLVFSYSLTSRLS